DRSTGAVPFQNPRRSAGSHWPAVHATGCTRSHPRRIPQGRGWRPPTPYEVPAQQRSPYRRTGACPRTPASWCTGRMVPAGGLSPVRVEQEFQVCATVIVLGMLLEPVLEEAHGV